MRWKPATRVIRHVGESEIPALLQSAASALVNRGRALAALNRTQEALEAYDEVIRRFGESEIPAIRERVARAHANRGIALDALNRPQDALKSYDEVVRRFGKSDIPAILESVATALLKKGAAFEALSRPRDALETCDEVVRRFGDSAFPALLERVATALTNKGAVLRALDRPQEAMEAYDEVVHRFWGSARPAFGVEVNDALLGRAEIEIQSRQYEKAAETAGRAIERRHEGTPAQRLRGHLIRATALFTLGDRSAGEHDVQAVLALPDLGAILRDGVMALIDVSVALGPQRMLELIQASPSADLLLPLTTALERELGQEPRVAREVNEVARDIQEVLAARKANRSRPLQKREG